MRNIKASEPQIFRTHQTCSLDDLHQPHKLSQQQFTLNHPSGPPAIGQGGRTYLVSLLYLTAQRTPLPCPTSSHILTGSLSMQADSAPREMKGASCCERRATRFTRGSLTGPRGYNSWLGLRALPPRLSLSISIHNLVPSSCRDVCKPLTAPSDGPALLKIIQQGVNPWFCLRCPLALQCHTNLSSHTQQ